MPVERCLRGRAPGMYLALAAACHCAAVPARAPLAGADPGGCAAAPATSEDTAPPRLGRGVFLVSRAGLEDPNFGHSVILITHYDDNGTAGVIINRELSVAADEALPPLARLGVDAGRLHFGGPVSVNSMQILVRPVAAMDESLRVLADVYLIDNPESLEQLASGAAAVSGVRAYAGYTGWGPGQLESEVLRGDWYLLPGDAADVFSADPDALWPRLIQRATSHWVQGPAPGLALVRAGGERIMPDSWPAARAGPGIPRRTAGAAIQGNAQHENR